VPGAEVPSAEVPGSGSRIAENGGSPEQELQNNSGTRNFSHTNNHQIIKIHNGNRG